MARPKAAPRGIRTPQQARSRRTREKILEAALTCFEEQGYDETTTAAIARRAHIAVGTLYGYFGDKRDILLEVLDRTLREVVDYVVRGLDPELWDEGDPRESVRRLIDAVFRARTVSPGASWYRSRAAARKCSAPSSRAGTRSWASSATSAATTPAGAPTTGPT